MTTTRGVARGASTATGGTACDCDCGGVDALMDAGAPRAGPDDPGTGGVETVEGAGAGTAAAGAGAGLGTTAGPAGTAFDGDAAAAFGTGRGTGVGRDTICGPDADAFDGVVPMLV